jgi:hypothetical protein
VLQIKVCDLAEVLNEPDRPKANAADNSAKIPRHLTPRTALRFACM